MKKLIYILPILLLSSCFVTKKKYDALEQEIATLKSDLKDDDRDGVPNYLDKEANTDSLAHVNTKGQTVRTVKIVDMDEDGILDVNDFCPTIKGIAVANGCPDGDGDGLYDFLDKCPSESGHDSLAGCPYVKPSIDLSSLKPFLFKYKDKTIHYISKTKQIEDSLLLHIQQVLASNEQFVLEIRSYTDSIGDSLKNEVLCQKRAELLRSKLLKKGSKKEQLKISVFSSQNPRYSNDTKEGRQANNRIECVVTLREEDR